MSEPVNLTEELDLAQLSRRHWIMVGVLAVVTLFDGYNAFVAASAIPFLMPLWHLLPSQAGLMVSSGLVGFMIGSLACGLVADRIGRKPTLLSALCAAGLFSLATAAFATTPAVFLLLRLLTGICLGALLPLAVTLINESAPTQRRNLLSGCVMIGWSTGGVVAALAATLLGRRYGWPSLFWVAGMAVPLAALCWLVLPESPKFLLLLEREPQARAVMGWLFPDRAYAQVRFAPLPQRPKTALMDLFAPAVRNSTLVVWFCASCSLFTIYGLSSWLPQTMIHRGEGFAASFAYTALLQSAAVVGGIVCGVLADRFDRRRVLALLWLLAAASISALALVNSRSTNILFIVAAGFGLMGAHPVLNNLTASLYGTQLRSTGVGAQLGVGRLGGILGPYVGGWLQQVYGGGGAGMFLAMGAALALSAASMMLLGSATRDDVIMS